MNDINTYIDESGILTKTANSDHRYLIIALVHTCDCKNVAKKFRIYRSKAIKHDTALMNSLKVNKELKGSETPELMKKRIYSELIKQCPEVEFGIIVIDTLLIEERFHQSKARAFNYLLKLYFKKYARVSKNFENESKIHLIIDEQNIATQSKHTLREYLNTELCFGDSKFNNDFSVQYEDSKNYLLIQLADYIANTTYRSLMNNDTDADENLRILNPNVIGNKFFKFPNK